MKKAMRKINISIESTNILQISSLRSVPWAVRMIWFNAESDVIDAYSNLQKSENDVMTSASKKDSHCCIFVSLWSDDLHTL